MRVTTTAAAAPEAHAVRRALRGRLRALAPLLGADAPAAVDGGDPARDAAALALALARRCAGGDRALLWPLHVALAGAYPSPDEVVGTRRRLELDPVEDVATDLVDRSLRRGAGAGTLLRPARLVTGRPVVDVGFSATSAHHTGIQRVVRALLPRWRPDSYELAGWDLAATGLRGLSAAETDMVLRFRHGTPPPDDPVDEVLVPHRTTLLLPEVPSTAQSDRLLALARLSSVAVVAVGYDTIPVVDADKLPPGEPAKFTRYVSVLKHARTVLAISAASARQFEGLVAMLAAQGLPGPAVRTCSLPTEGLGGTAVVAEPPDVPEVVAVGSHEPRKNQARVVQAAERLWREGHRFRLRLLGTGGWESQELDETVRALQGRGRPVRVERGADDDAVVRAYASARFTVFVSLHEGFGLPVAESLAAGTPVLTSAYGSTAEVAAGGGAVLVDPRDPAALTDAMRRLLTDDALVERLRAEAAARRARTWDEYAAEVADEVGAAARREPA